MYPDVERVYDIISIIKKMIQTEKNQGVFYSFTGTFGSLEILEIN